VVAVLASASASAAQPNSAPSKGHPATKDGLSVTFHIHRAHVLYRSAYELERWDTGPKRSEIRKAQRHKQAIRVAKTRDQLSEFRDRQAQRLSQYAAEQRAYAAITPPGPEWLAALRQCESGGNYATNTGNGFYGAYQFTLSTWASVGGSGYPHLAAPAEQDYRAAVLYRTGGPGHWPNCP